MSLPIKTGFPDGVTVGPGYTVRFRATNPTTGADVPGVTVSNASVFVENVGAVELVVPGNLMYVPASGGGP